MQKKSGIQHAPVIRALEGEDFTDSMVNQTRSSMGCRFGEKPYLIKDSGKQLKMLTSDPHMHTRV